MNVKCRDDAEKRYFDTRLKTIEGQVRGIRGMIEENRYCNDILIQISAVIKSLKSVENELLKNHLSTCVVRDIKNDKLEIIDEFMDFIKKIN